MEGTKQSSPEAQLADTAKEGADQVTISERFRVTNRTRGADLAKLFWPSSTFSLPFLLYGYLPKML